MKKKLLIVTVLILVLLASLTGCAAREDASVFGTNFSAYIYGSVPNKTKTINSMISYIQELELILSTSIEGSDIYKINNSKVNEPIICNQVTMDIMKIAEEVCRESDGAYDPTVSPLVELWKFSADKFIAEIKDYVPPKDEDIKSLLHLVGLTKTTNPPFTIDYENKTITKNLDGAKLDLGGIAKGYAVDKACDMALSKQKALLNLGGNIAAANSSFVIKIQKPEIGAIQSYTASISLGSQECIATSGDYQRYYKVGDTIYHHIINPKTGYPSDNSSSNNSLKSVSIISKDGAVGDAVATAVMVLGKEKGSLLISRLNLKGVMVDKDMNPTFVGLDL